MMFVESVSLCASISMRASENYPTGQSVNSPNGFPCNSFNVNSENLLVHQGRIYGTLSIVNGSKCITIYFSYFLSLYSFYQSLRRRNYVTPTSYLELIMTFKKLLDIKRQEIMTFKQRYVTGLEKLDFASSQVSVMQQELSDLQPELIKTSAETAKLMIKIEQDTVEVEAKKEVRVSGNISNTRDSVSSHFQTPRRELKIRCAAEYF